MTSAAPRLVSVPAKAPSGIACMQFMMDGTLSQSLAARDALGLAFGHA